MKTKKGIGVLIISILIVIGLVILLIIKNSADQILNIVEVPSSSVNTTPTSITTPEIEETEQPGNNGNTSTELSSPVASKDPLETEVAVESPTPTTTPDPTSTPASDTPVPNEETTFEAPIYELDVEEVSNWFTMDQEGVLQLIGPEYEIIQTGADDSYTGYYYKNLGLTFIFTPSGKTLNAVMCNDNVRINGAHAGMTFDRIQEILGEKDVKSVYVEDYQRTDHYFEYVFNNIRYEFSSTNEDGQNSKLVIMR